MPTKTVSCEHSASDHEPDADCERDGKSALIVAVSPVFAEDRARMFCFEDEIWENIMHLEEAEYDGYGIGESTMDLFFYARSDEMYTCARETLMHFADETHKHVRVRFYDTNNVLHEYAF